MDRAQIGTVALRLRESVPAGVSFSSSRSTMELSVSLNGRSDIFEHFRNCRIYGDQKWILAKRWESWVLLFCESTRKEDKFFKIKTDSVNTISVSVCSRIQLTNQSDYSSETASVPSPRNGTSSEYWRTAGNTPSYSGGTWTLFYSFRADCRTFELFGESLGPTKIQPLIAWQNALTFSFS